MNPALASLDQTELLQLALNASAAGDGGSALGYLKEAVARADATGLAHYMLGAEYAQARLYERATAEMEAALALAPGLAIARLQLGLLWLCGNAPARARAVLIPLTELAPEHYLHRFGQGLLALLDDRLADARAALVAGIAANAENPPLNGDMQRLIDGIDAAPVAGAGTASDAPAGVPADPAPGTDEQALQMLLAAYTGNVRH